MALSVSIEFVSLSARVTSVKSAQGNSVSQFQTTGPIDRTPGTPGSDKNVTNSSDLIRGIGDGGAKDDANRVFNNSELTKSMLTKSYLCRTFWSLPAGFMGLDSSRLYLVKSKSLVEKLLQTKRGRLGSLCEKLFFLLFFTFLAAQSCAHRRGA